MEQQHIVAHSVGYYPEVIPCELISLMEKEVKNIDTTLFSPGEVGTYSENSVDLKLRNSKITWWYEDHWVSSIFCHYFNRANRDLWEYDLTFLNGIQITSYDKDDHYTWHSDYGSEPDSNHTRKLSASLLISDPTEFEGGDLEFINYHGKVSPAPRTKGTMIIFDSRIPHRVTPVTKGKRISLVAWMLGPKLR